MASIAPCLWFNNEAEQAAKVYTRLLPNSRIKGTSRYPERIDNPANKPQGSIMTVEAELAGRPFTLLNGGPNVEPNPSLSFILNFDPSMDPKARENLDAAWAALSLEGDVLMPLDSYPFSERYGWIQDRFGISWQLILTDPEGDERPFIVPALLFTGNVAGRAEEAMSFYTNVFDDANEGLVARYPPGMEPEQEGTIMFADFTLEEQWFACMDSAQEHDFAFNEGISLQILCEDQATIDRYWDALIADAGKAGPCGWLKDPFGVSWQILPTHLIDMISDDNPGSKRAFQAMLEMNKLDLPTLETAYEGTNTTN